MCCIVLSCVALYHVVGVVVLFADVSCCGMLCVCMCVCAGLSCVALYYDMLCGVVLGCVVCCAVCGVCCV